MKISKILKTVALLLALVFICLTFDGCMNSQKLSDLTIVEGIAVDESDENIEICVQSLNTNSQSGLDALSGNITFTSSSTGVNMSRAVSALSQNLSKELFFGQNKITVFSCDIAKNTFADKLDYLLRSSNSRPDTAVCLAYGSAKDIIESSENDALIPSQTILSLIKNSEKTGLGIYITTSDLLNFYTDKTTDIILPVLEKDEQNDIVSIKGLGLFDDDALKYITNKDEALGILFILGKIECAGFDVESQELGNIGMNIISSKTSSSFFTKDGKLYFNCDITVNAQINEIENGILTTIGTKQIEEIELLCEDKISTLCQNSFACCQKYNSDCLRVGEYMAKDDKTAYNNYSENWNKYFEDVIFNASVSVKIKKTNNNSFMD